MWKLLTMRVKALALSLRHHRPLTPQRTWNLRLRWSKRMNTPYIDQVRLLVKLLPIVATQSCFALKGGTAKNLFLRDMPRLSVDIDLTYLPIEDRDTSLDGIDTALGNIIADIEK